jgi:hypothetical protein
MLGYPAAALADTQNALEDAHEIAQAATLFGALIFACLTTFIAETTRQLVRS